jgi:hypothetical protein
VLNLDPRIKPTLSNGVDLIFKAVENQRSEEGLTCGTHRPASLQVGLAGPTCQWLKLCHGGLPSRVFLSLPNLVSLRINVICFDK